MNDKAKPAARKKFVAIKKFCCEAGTANEGDVVSLTAAEAKHFNKAKAIGPYIEESGDPE